MLGHKVVGEVVFHPVCCQGWPILSRLHKRQYTYHPEVAAAVVRGSLSEDHHNLELPLGTVVLRHLSRNKHNLWFRPTLPRRLPLEVILEHHRKFFCKRLA